MLFKASNLRLMASNIKLTGEIYSNYQEVLLELNCCLDSCNEKITLALRSKHKPIALSHLRSRKQLEDLLGKRLGSLEVLRSTLIRVEGAAGDVEVCHFLLSHVLQSSSFSLDNGVL